ncbi:ABC transporter substrate-binding protein [Bordetella genomosp. 5]|uniref:ABC transporter substrate-binding protein n=1 Tax=Bordetella genomosp. 5 TaxID=1395608 RepID=UPI0015958D06|nr:ABC transporter substrate-binding protein [Bordetella genomosp. 5]
MPFRFVIALFATTLMLGAATASATSAPQAPAARMPAGATPPPIRLGDIIGSRQDPAQAAYRKGWQLALEALNAEGGVLGRKLQVVTREDGGQAQETARLAAELADREGVVALMGGASEATAGALSAYAGEHQILYLATLARGEALTWSRNNRYTYRLPPSVRMRVAAVAPKALGQRKTRWAIVHRDDEAGRESAAAFRSVMQAFQSHIEFVATQPLPTTAKALDETVRALADARPDALFLDLDAAGLARFAHAGYARQLFDGRAVVALDAANPDAIAALEGGAGMPAAGVPAAGSPAPGVPSRGSPATGAPAPGSPAPGATVPTSPNAGAAVAGLPAGWLVTGYAWEGIASPAAQAFVEAYRKRHGETPTASALLGYAAIQSFAAGLRVAQTTDSAQLAEAFSGLRVDTPVATIHYRPLDHQSTLGVYTGLLTGAPPPAAVNSVNYQEGGRLQPLDHDVRRLRGEGRARTAPAATAAPAPNAPAQNAASDAAADAAPTTPGKAGATPAQPRPATSSHLVRPATPVTRPADTWTPDAGPVLQDWPSDAQAR